MVNIFLFFAIAFLFTFLAGKLFEKIRVPWVFSALFFGSLLAIKNPFFNATSSETFSLLSELGMYFLLFIIGFEINLKEFKKQGKFIFKSVFFIIFLEAIFGSLLLYFLFGYSLIVSIIVAVSFATVGEAILVPILEEFKIVNTKLGQSIIGIGTLDDIIEIVLLVIVSVLIGVGTYSYSNILFTFLYLVILVLMAAGLIYLKKTGSKFNFLSIETLFLFVLFGFFAFLGIGKLADATPIAAFLAGISLKTFIPHKRLIRIESIIKALCYGFFAPLFFIWVGLSIDITYLAFFPLFIVLVVIVSSGAKILGSYLVGRNELGSKNSILMGVGLSVRFSTSLVIIKLLFEKNIIGSDLYSVIVASSIVFIFIIPLVFSRLLSKMKIKGGKNG